MKILENFNFELFSSDFIYQRFSNPQSILRGSFNRKLWKGNENSSIYLFFNEVALSAAKLIFLGSFKLRQKFPLFNKYFSETALVINLINVKVYTRLAISLNYDLAGKWGELYQLKSFNSRYSRRYNERKLKTFLTAADNKIIFSFLRCSSSFDFH